MKTDFLFFKLNTRSVRKKADVKKGHGILMCIVAFM